MRAIHDISLTISPGMPVWPGDPPVRLERTTSMAAGAHANVSHLALSVHTGTHVDAPDHFLNDGRTVESLDLHVLTGPAQVVELPAPVTLIGAGELERAGVPAGTERLLLKTRNSRFWGQAEARFETDFCALSPDGARWLVGAGVRLVGVDYLSVAPYREGTAVHRLLLEAGLVVLEGLDLSRVAPGAYDLYCLPLRLAGSDGAPARVILVG